MLAIDAVAHAAAAPAVPARAFTNAPPGLAAVAGFLLRLFRRKETSELTPGAVRRHPQRRANRLHRGSEAGTMAIRSGSEADPNVRRRRRRQGQKKGGHHHG
jgi:hypothetical protein